MTGKTYRLITLWFCLIFGLAWTSLTIQAGAMYVPPLEISSFMVALLGGKWWQSMEQEKGSMSIAHSWPLSQSHSYPGGDD
ncbi:MAG: hypothetical protein RBS34_00590 [Desulfofustis sp.]|jgi:hypothetical protein|nr:hypothetical protein [Desulfofustis sp.]